MFLINRCSGAGWLGTALFLFITLFANQSLRAEISPDQVYAQVQQIENEIAAIKRFYNISINTPVAKLDGNLDSSHVWQKAYMIQIKLNIWRRHTGIGGFSPVNIEPDLKLSPRLSYGQVVRTLTELRILKTYLGITNEMTPIKPEQGKSVMDNLNKLNQISTDMDSISGEAINSSYVYAEAIRLNEDVNSLLTKAGIFDEAVPLPRKPDAQNKDALEAVFAVMNEIQRIQRQLDVENNEFSPFTKSENVQPDDVFTMVVFCIAELRLLKAKLQMKHDLTPQVDYYEGKTPVDIVQLLGYVTNKLRLINFH